MQRPNAINSGLLPTRQRSKRDIAVQAIRNALADNDLDKAKELTEPFIKKSDDDAEMLLLFGVLAEALGMTSDALEWARRSIKVRAHVENHLLAARLLRRKGQTEDALDHLEQAHRVKPTLRGTEPLRAGILEEAGRFEEARAVLEPVYSRLRGLGGQMPVDVLMNWAKILVQFKELDQAVEVIDEILGLTDVPEEVQSQVLYLQAKAHDRAKRYESAVASAARANQFNKIEFDPDLYVEQVAVLMENWNRETMAQFPVSTCDSPIPVFVAGMPRSGTSLIDQIIDAHPKAAGVGELSSIEAFAVELSRAYDPAKDPKRWFGKFDGRQWTKRADKYVEQIRNLAPEGAERIVNKALGNNKLVGLLAQMFPNTRIIHAIRDPRDVAISCYMGGFNNNLIAWTTEIEWVAHSWAQSIRMMNHWKQTVDVPILDVHYERLVADPENEMPRIIEFLGLEWDDACRDFYKSKRTVRTLSYDQVNRPLYTSSSGRHKNYAELIAGVEFPPYDPFADPPVAG